MGICTMPSMSYSTGSSVVISLSSIPFNSFNAPYNVVVLPQPVGPVTSTMPLGRRITSRNERKISSGSPITSRSSMTTERSRIRITTLSPNIVGSTATRRSTG